MNTNGLVRALGFTAAMLFVGALPTVEMPEGTTFAKVVEMVGTSEAAAQANGNGGGGGELTCGWCEEDWFCGALMGCFSGHRFEGGGDACGWANGNGGGGGEAECSRCGGTSECHFDPEPGDCHLECGPGGGELASAAIRDLKESIQRADLEGIARVVRTVRWMVFTPGELSVRVAAPCGADGSLTVYPLPLMVAERFTALLAEAQ